jgi:two-component system invasion response regulator UvrY
MKRILIADDHSVVRRGIKQILKDEFSSVQLGEASTVQEVYALLEEGQWDLLILDINLSGKNGLEVLKELKNRKSRVPVLVLSMHPEDQFALRSVRAGASGYLTKAGAPEELITAITKILQGGRYVTSTLAEKLATELAGNADKPLHETLSDREYHVMCMIASGKTVSQIGDELSLSVKTISTYRRRLCEKMHMRTNAELTHYVIENKLS